MCLLGASSYVPDSYLRRSHTYGDVVPELLTAVQAIANAIHGQAARNCS
jgi:hypothetical protein